MAPPGNLAANRKNKLQPIAIEDPGRLDKSHGLGSWQVGLRETSASEPFDEGSKDYGRGQNWASILGPGQVLGGACCVRDCGGGSLGLLDSVVG